MGQIINPIHRVYNISTDNGEVRERIVLDYGDFEFKDHPSNSVLVINRMRINALCAALEITSLDGEVAIHFVLSDGFSDRYAIRYKYPTDTIQDLAEDVASNIDSHHVIRDIEIEADLRTFFDKPYLPHVIDPAVHQKQLLAQLSAKWLARYIAYNFKVSATISLKDKEKHSLAGCIVEVGLNLPCSPSLGLTLFGCQADSPNQEAWYFAKL